MGRGGVQRNTQLRAPFQSIDCKHPGNLGGKKCQFIRIQRNAN